MKKQLLLLVLPLAMAFQSKGQLNYFVAGASTNTGTYSDISASGTLIATANTDDDNSAPQNIGFSFDYSGSTFTQFVLNTNGFIKLGNSNPSRPDLCNKAGGQAIDSSALVSADAADINIISPLGFDLESATGALAEYRVLTSGTPGTRVCTIQFKNVKDKIAGYQYDNMQFQIKLYETTNIIEFVYGTWTASVNAAAFRSSACGLKGTNSTNLVIASKASASAWSATVFNPTYSPAVNAHNFRNAVPPDAGRTYRFIPAKANDAAVSSILTLGELPKYAGAPHSVQAVIRNFGTGAISNRSVTLNISGANTFTDSKTVSIAAGGYSLVTFSGFSPSNLGQNVITVSVPNDDDNSNNSSVVKQIVNNNSAFSYADSGKAFGSVGYNTSQGLILCKYEGKGTFSVTGVSVSLAGGSTLGKNVYAVLLDSTGHDFATSNTSYIVTSGDTGKYKNFLFSSPVQLTDSKFYVGLAQIANATGYFPVSFQQEKDDTLRKEAYYIRGLSDTTNVQEYNSLGRYMIKATLSPTPVGVSKVTKSAEVSIFPNPVADKLNIEFGNSNSTEFSARILDMSGKVIRSIESSKNAGKSVSSVSVSDLQSGAYMLELNDAGSVQIFRFTKN